MHPNSYNKERILATSDRIWELRTLKNYSLTKIATEMEMSVSTVHKRLQKVTVAYAKAHLAKLDHHKTLQVVDLQRVASAAWECWELSRTPLIIHKTTEVMNPETGQVTELKSTEVRPGRGDPLYLKEYRAALADIREILGINATLELNINVRSEDEHQTALGKFVDELIVANAKINANTITPQSLEKH